MSGTGLLVCMLLAAGCAGPDLRSAATRPTPVAPRWDTEAMATHLRFLGGSSEGGSSSEERALRYAADRMRAYALQPVLKDGFRFEAAEPGGLESGVAGYVVGKHPARQRELVVVGAALPEAGAPPTGAAAVLELARAYSAFATFGLVPERTILFALWPNAGGLSAYLETPAWAIEETRAALSLDLAPEAQPALQALAATYGLRAYGVRPAADLSGVARVRALSEQAHRVLLPEVISGGPLLPLLGDTLRVPAAEPNSAETDSL